MSMTGQPGSHDDDDQKPAASAGGQQPPASPPASPSASRFTYKNLADLAVASPTCPLRVVAHIDLDAYYAQCEMLRLGTDENTPLVVQQWRNIIAVNYPARAYGITRMISAVDAQKLCPHLVVQHVPSWKEGEGQWAYHADAFRAMAHHKVSLEPYRIRSRAILATLKASLPSTPTMAAPCKIEKAGIDEVFVDLSPYIHDVLVRSYADMLRAGGDEDGMGALLPRPPVGEADLDWAATGSDVIDGGDTDNEAVDWDDVAVLEGARVVQAMRQALLDRLRFRCSAGIASNKMLSKLGSSQHKPNKQTVVRARAVTAFLAGLPSVAKLRGLGGKMGARVVAAFGTPSIAALRQVSLPQMQARLNDQEAGYSIYWMLRGVDTSEVTARTDIKSIISAKSFQPPLTTAAQAVRWLRVYVAELKCRLLDEKQSLALLAAVTVGDGGDDAGGGGAEGDAKGGGAEGDAEKASTTATTSGTSTSSTAHDGPTDTSDKQEPVVPQHHLRLPQTIRLHYGQSNGQAYGQGWRSRQMRIPRDGTPLDEDKLLRLGKQLLEQAQQAGSLWPCAHLALSVDGFEEPAKGNKSIESFFQPKSSAASGQGGPGEGLGDGHDNTDNEYDDNGDDHDAPSDAPHAGSVEEPNDHDTPPLAKRRRTAAVARPADCYDGDDGCKGKGEAGPGSGADEPAVATSGSGGSNGSSSSGSSSARGGSTTTKRKAEGLSLYFGSQSHQKNANGDDHNNSTSTNRNNSGRFACSRCSQSLATAVQLQEHQDWHVARDLQARESAAAASSASTATGALLPSRRRGTGHAKRGEGGAGGPPLPPSIHSFFHSQTPSGSNARGGNSSKSHSSSSSSGGSSAGDALSCPRCGATFSHADQAQVHQDWHFAKDLASRPG